MLLVIVIHTFRVPIVDSAPTRVFCCKMHKEHRMIIRQHRTTPGRYSTMCTINHGFDQHLCYLKRITIKFKKHTYSEGFENKVS